MRMFLPKGQAWVGFDDRGISIAASIEAAKPRGTKSVMEGCAVVHKCTINEGETFFGRHISDFQRVEE